MIPEIYPQALQFLKITFLMKLQDNFSFWNTLSDMSFLFFFIYLRNRAASTHCLYAVLEFAPVTMKFHITWLVHLQCYNESQASILWQHTVQSS